MADYDSANIIIHDYMFTVCIYRAHDGQPNATGLHLRNLLEDLVDGDGPYLANKLVRMFIKYPHSENGEYVYGLSCGIHEESPYLYVVDVRLNKRDNRLKCYLCRDVPFKDKTEEYIVNSCKEIEIPEAL